MVKISIVMPVYNGAKYLEKSLESISNQTFKDVELICVDDGSTDNSLDLLNDYKNKYNFLKVISQENQGSGKARNTGLDNADGEYIAFLDADDIYVDENALEVMYDIAVSNDADIVSANLTFVSRKYEITENFHYERGDYVFFDEKSEISPDDYGIPYAFYKNIFKKEFLDSNDIRFPDLLRGQDPVFLAKSFAGTDRIYTADVVLYGYNNTVGGGVNNKMNNYMKKKSYVQHFRDTCDVLSEAGLTKTSETYKLHLSRYLNWKKNKFNEDLFKIYGEIFPDRYEYFDENDENFIVFNASAEAYLQYHSDDNEEFIKVKDRLSQIDTELLPKKVMERHNLILESESLDDYKDNYYNDRIAKLKKRNENLKKRIDELSDENEELEVKLAGLDEKLNKVKSSSSFKIAKKFKNALK